MAKHTSVQYKGYFSQTLNQIYDQEFKCWINSRNSTSDKTEMAAMIHLFTLYKCTPYSQSTYKILRNSYSYSYKVTLFQQLFSDESCSVGLSEKMGFQLRSELLATVVR